MKWLAVAFAPRGYPCSAYFVDELDRVAKRCIILAIVIFYGIWLQKLGVPLRAGFLVFALQDVKTMLMSFSRFSKLTRILGVCEFITNQSIKKRWRTMVSVVPSVKALIDGVPAPASIPCA
ncbi:uncharacterized protein [Lolium perenne]|uniref:uncharacterized protein n=1 Tax=Lolium perenne TaxID=4522 RepID=UPI0021F63A40|nr:uncharacterized protein LOC127344006 [Lolium perenne]